MSLTCNLILTRVYITVMQAAWRVQLFWFHLICRQVMPNNYIASVTLYAGERSSPDVWRWLSATYLVLQGRYWQFWQLNRPLEKWTSSQSIEPAVYHFMTTVYSKVVFKIVLLCIGHWYISFQHLLAKLQRIG